MLLTTALKKFEVQLQANGRSHHTIAQYDRHIRSLDRWMAEQGIDRRVDRISHEVIARYLASPAATHRADGEPKRASSVNVLRSSLRAFFAFVQAAGYSSRNPAVLVRSARCGPAPPRALTATERERFLGALDRGRGHESERDRLLFQLMLLTGIRLGEALALTVDDLDPEQTTMRLRRAKGDVPRDVPIPEALREAIGGWRSRIDGRWLFSAAAGGPISARHARRRFQSVIRRSGIARSLSPHSLRHAFARHAYAESRDLLRLKEKLGHRSVSATLVYAK